MSTDRELLADRELLELAAKAAGIQGFSGEDWTGVYFCTPANPDVPRSEPVIYKWLDDDGDALRLAVECLLTIDLSEGKVLVEAPWLKNEFSEDYVNDKMHATRRAIVRAAAAIGEQMP